MKTCTKCNELKPLDAFYKAKGTADGLRHQCKTCYLEYMRPVARKNNKNQCFVEGKYLPVSDPLHVAGGRFKTRLDLHNWWRENLGKLKAEVPSSDENVSGEGYVYIITNPAWDDWYKIGKADDLERRLSNYQTGDPHRSYKICYEMKFDDCRSAENAVKDMVQNDDKLIRKNEWVSGSFERICNIIKEVKREEVSSGHRDELNCQFDLVLRN